MPPAAAPSGIPAPNAKTQTAEVKKKQPLKTASARVTGKSKKSSLSALMLGNGKTFYAYVYDHMQLHCLPREPEQYARDKGATLSHELGTKHSKID